MLFSLACTQPEDPTAYLLASLERESEHIYFPLSISIEKAELEAIFSRLLATEPHLFYVAPYYTVAEGMDGRVTFIEPTYRYSGTSRIEAEHTYESALLPLLAPAKEMKDPKEQLRYLFSYLTRYYTYDKSHTASDTYTLLTEGYGVCQAFSLLLYDLCERLSIPSQIVICYPLSHQWNRVYLDGEWLAIDLSWALSEGERYFLVEDATLLSLRIAKDPAWSAAPIHYYPPLA